MNDLENTNAEKMRAPLVDKEYWDFLNSCSIIEAHEYDMECYGESALGKPNSAVNQWSAIREIESCRVRYESGDDLSLLDAIFKCAMSSICMPNWVELAYIKRYRNILHFKAKTLDEAFGKPFKKGVNLNALRKRNEKAVGVWLEIRNASKMGESIDDELFEKIGEKFNIGRTLAKEYYSYMNGKNRFASKRRKL